MSELLSCKDISAHVRCVTMLMCVCVCVCVCVSRTSPYGDETASVIGLCSQMLQQLCANLRI